MTSQFNTVHPRGGNPANPGQFSEKTAADPGTGVLGGPPTNADPVPDHLLNVGPQPQFGLAERGWLAQNAGKFVDGYTDTMIDRFAAGLPSMKVACVWDSHDQFGFGGDSQLYGQVGDGPWRPFSSEANSYLTDGQPGDDLPAAFLDRPDGLKLNIDTVEAMESHNYTLLAEPKTRPPVPDLLAALRESLREATSRTKEQK